MLTDEDAVAQDVVEALRQRIARLEVDKARLRKRITLQDATISMQNAALRSYESLTVDLAEQVAGLRSENGDLRIDNRGLRSESGELRSDNWGLRIDNSDLRYENHQLRSENPELKSAQASPAGTGCSGSQAAPASATVQSVADVALPDAPRRARTSSIPS
jgi:regulator of replication initiation timing